MEEENEQFSKFYLRVFLSFCLIFCQFQTGVAYKSATYETKNVYFTDIFYENKVLKLKL